MPGGIEPFKLETAWDAVHGRHQRVQVAVCSGCGRRALIHDAGDRKKPPEFMAGKFRAKGWRIGSRRNHDLGPCCAGGGASSLPRRRRWAGRQAQARSESGAKARRVLPHRRRAARRRLETRTAEGG